jgi:hypothetical protein
VLKRRKGVVWATKGWVSEKISQNGGTWRVKVAGPVGPAPKQVLKVDSPGVGFKSGTAYPAV